MMKHIPSFNFTPILSHADAGASPFSQHQSQFSIWASVLAANFGALARDIEAMTLAGVDGFHVDVMDGHFVPNISFGLVMARVIKSHTHLPFDVHLMVSCLDHMVEASLQLNPQWVHIHAEGEAHVHRWVTQITARGVGASVAINPHTPAQMVLPLFPDLATILVMTVNPGFGGQKLILSCIDKIRTLRALGFTGRIMVDGGVDATTIAELAQAGATDFVVGTSAFRGGNQAFADNIRILREQLSAVDSHSVSSSNDRDIAVNKKSTSQSS